MKNGFGIKFDVPISDRIAQSAKDIAFIFGTQLNLERRPQIQISNTITLERRARGSITGFSSGVDSWFTIKENLIECRYPSRKIKYLLVNDVGANRDKSKKEHVRQRAQAIAQDFGLRVICIKSNIDELLRMGFQKTHTARNASVAHLLTSICDTFYYSSADTYADAGVFSTYDMAYADTIILPLLSSDAISLMSSGSSFTRAEKTREILDIPRIGDYLDVCVSSGHSGTKINCGACWKCLRTELTLEAFDALSQFEPVFDLDAYRKGRRRYIQTVSLSKKPSEREAFDLARKAGLAGPRFAHQLREAPMRAAERITRSAGRLRRVLRVR